ncbi:MULTISPECIES: DUF6325 family protein [Candidatus Neomicrothrix]|jgi:hypothetical protein|uniref:DUF1269 domain-containing family protein n=1 Tax=Candidatus Neomicrothrix parvicella RN1 TaxID=1229780 RepID=R4YYB9_9ACTN|nr:MULTISPECIES: DUF6325 family protein [Microthrix]NLH66245.1 DUF1269 domain-containing protein [Candidatus Microthrix parvicella]MBK7323332.1 DUF1269 domain-containing protein [Candidatus Microthrix sp.]MBL0205162.1 DUF1269 domain-containing protein [Candidatus Microthrix sp.]MBP6136337.1 DUF1269 domain-containing protein [Candidatus Microthrix sp.]MBP7405634.1 DUF1269 domain-containing protein [Candidatus Microthrix sp.]
MNDVSEEELGPIDYMVVEFPAGTSNFSGAMAAELAALAEAELIRVLDLMILTKDQDGNIEVLEVEDLDGTGELGSIEADLAEILAFEDVENLAAAMEPGSTAGVLIWENTWAAPFAVAARQSGGQLIASGRIPTQALIASFENDDNEGAE